MANTFRNKKVEEGLDERSRIQNPASDTTTTNTSQLRGNTFRTPKPTAPTSEKEPEPTPENTDTTQDAPKTNPSEPTTTTKPRRNLLGHILGGDVLGKQWVRNQKGLIVLIILFGVILVTNRYTVERLTKDKLATEERIKFLREQRIQMKKSYQESVRISNISNDLDSMGVGIIAGPPYELATANGHRKR